MRTTGVCPGLLLLLLASCSTARPGGAGPAPPPATFSLRDAAVVVHEQEPPSVRHAAADLADFLRESGGGMARVLPVRALDALPVSPATLVFVGSRMRDALRAAGAAPGHAVSGEEGPGFFHLMAFAYRGAPAVLAAGACDLPDDAEGARLAVVTLQLRARVGDGAIDLPAGLTEYRAPRFRRRGVYAHQHWAYHRPYALRAWTAEDWKRYVDLLAHLRFNLLQLWTMAGLCPHPLSEEDRRFLLRYTAAIEHGKTRWGMEFWPGECANNVCDPPGDVPIEAREYKRIEALLDPTDPAAMDRLVRNRRDMIEAVPNGDAYWVIDSDPGQWPGSPTSEFVDILIGNRRLLDAVHPRGAKTPLVYWMWDGWGGGRDANRPRLWRETLRDMKARLPEPWIVHGCKPEHLDAIREAGLIDRAMYFPYNAGEPEPSAPHTAIRFAEIRKAVREAADAGPLLGVMVNLQTPAVQLPNLYYFSRCAFDPAETETPDEAILRDLARLVAPRIAEPLAFGWGLLLPSAETPDRAADCFHAADLLDAIKRSGDVGPPGAIGRHVIPDIPTLVGDLARRLRLRGLAFEAERAIEGEGAALPMETALAPYLRAGLEWQRRTGYHDRGWITGWEVLRVQAAWAGRMKTGMAADAGRVERLRGLMTREGFDDWLVVRALSQIVGGDPADLLGPGAGFIRAWRLLGPFDDPFGRGLLRPHIDESAPDFEAESAGKGGAVLKWAPYASPAAAVLLHERYPRVESAAAYAATAFHSEAERPALARVGSNDGFRLWVNGAEAGTRAVYRSMEMDQDVLPVTLRKGWNTVLIKVSQGFGKWGFYLRFTTPEGAPIDGQADPAMWNSSRR
jgi:hypothetical protein